MLELQKVSFAVQEDDKIKYIVRDIDLVIKDKFVAITGPNGSGKSTLAKLIVGIIQPTEGRILFNGEDITDLSIDERAKRGISYAFQQPVKFKGLKVFELISLAAGRANSFRSATTLLAILIGTAKEYPV